MNFQQMCSFIAGILAVVSFLPYVWSIYKRRTKPQRVTWIIWLTLNLLTSVAMYMSNALNGQMAAYVLGDAAVVVLSIHYGKGGGTTLDRWCFLGAIVGIAAWAVTKNPIYGIIFGMSVDSIGSIPTIEKTWHHPEQEDVWHGSSP